MAMTRQGRSCSVKHPLLPLSFLLFFGSTSHAQAPQLQLRTGLVQAASVVPDQRASLFSDGADAVDGSLVRCLLFDHTLGASERGTIAGHGVRFMSPLRPHAWVCLVPMGMDARILFDHGLIAIHTFNT